MWKQYNEKPSKRETIVLFLCVVFFFVRLFFLVHFEQISFCSHFWPYYKICLGVFDATSFLNLTCCLYHLSGELHMWSCKCFRSPPWAETKHNFKKDKGKKKQNKRKKMETEWNERETQKITVRWFLLGFGRWISFVLSFHYYQYWDNCWDIWKKNICDQKKSTFDNFRYLWEISGFFFFGM